MRKNKKLPPKPFDVGDFLRPTDTDLRSALNSLLHGHTTGPDPSIGSGIRLDGEQNTLPWPTTSGIELTSATGVAPALERTPPCNVEPPIENRVKLVTSGLKLTAQINVEPEAMPSPAEAQWDPSSIAAPGLTWPTRMGPPLVLDGGVKRRRFVVRPAHLIEDGHSRAEHQVYLSLWENAAPHDDISRLLTIGFASMGKLTGLSESNARINLRSLVQKLAIDEFDTYNCATSQGRTYRIYHAAEILRRRHAGGLRWIMRRTLAVVFVDPETKLPLFVKTGTISGPGLNLSAALILNSAIRGHLHQYGPADNATIEAFLTACREAQPALDPNHLAEVIHHQALLTRGMTPAQSIDFLLATVPAQLT